MNLFNFYVEWRNSYPWKLALSLFSLVLCLTQVFSEDIEMAKSGKFLTNFWRFAFQRSQPTAQSHFSLRQTHQEHVREHAVAKILDRITKHFLHWWVQTALFLVEPQTVFSWGKSSENVPDPGNIRLGFFSFLLLLQRGSNIKLLEETDS